MDVLTTSVALARLSDMEAKWGSDRTHTISACAVVAVAVAVAVCGPLACAHTGGGGAGKPWFMALVRSTGCAR